jgi:hypothetical protein
MGRWPELQLLRTDRASALLAFELENRAYFAAWARPPAQARRRRGVIRSGTEYIAANRSASPNRAPIRSAYLAR